MKKLVAALVLLLLWGCAGKKYGITEGPFRARFVRQFYVQRVNTLWTSNMLFDGVLPEEPVHIEGHIIINGTEYYRYHTDLPQIRSRIQEVKNIFMHTQYCESVGDVNFKFLDGLGENGLRGYSAAPPSGAVTVRFKFYSYKPNRQGDLVRGKLLTQAKTAVKLECPQCTCGQSR